MEIIQSILDAAWDLLGKPQTATAALLIGVLVAVRSINMHRLTEKQRETVQLMASSRTDETLGDGLKILERIHDDPNDNIRAYAREKKQDDNAAKIRYVLNHWERIAIGIQEGTYCERIVKKSHCSTFLSLYQQAAPMITAIREVTRKNTYYQELEWLASQWLAKPLEVRKPSRWRFWR